MLTVIRPLALLLMLFAGGCKQIVGIERGTPCGAAFRTTEGRGSVSDATGAPLASGVLSIVDLRDTVSTTLTIALTGASTTARERLRGHIRLVRVLSNNGVLLAERADLQQVPVAEATTAIVRSVTISLAPGDVAEGARVRLLADQLVLEVETDLPGTGTLRLPIRATLATEYIQPVCL